MSGTFTLPIKKHLCPCNGCVMIRCEGEWWCPHMGGTVEQHFQWQAANKLPPILCKYRKEEGR